jgi:hypothetical protein
MTEDLPGKHAAPPVPLWTRINLSEPVRVRLYAITAAVVAILVAYGVVDDSTAALWLALGAAALGLTSTEVVRASVVSPATAGRVAFDAATSSAATDYQAATQALHINGVPRP